MSGESSLELAMYQRTQCRMYNSPGKKKKKVTWLVACFIICAATGTQGCLFSGMLGLFTPHVSQHDYSEGTTIVLKTL